MLEAPEAGPLTTATQAYAGMAGATIVIIGIMVGMIYTQPAHAGCIEYDCRRECWPIPNGHQCRTACQRQCTPDPPYLPDAYMPPAASVPASNANDNILIFLVMAGLIWLCCLGASEEDDDAESPELDVEESLDPEHLLAELEARAPKHLSPIERVEWAAREGARIIAGRNER